MLTLPTQDAPASTASLTEPTIPTPQPTTQASGAIPPGPTPSKPYHREQVRLLLFGTPTGIQTTICLLHKLGYAEPNDWSRPISTGRAGEVMAILTKRVSAG